MESRCDTYTHEVVRLKGKVGMIYTHIGLRNPSCRRNEYDGEEEFHVTIRERGSREQEKEWSKTESTGKEKAISGGVLQRCNPKLRILKKIPFWGTHIFGSRQYIIWVKQQAHMIPLMGRLKKHILWSLISRGTVGRWLISLRPMVRFPLPTLSSTCCAPKGPAQRRLRSAKRSNLSRISFARCDSKSQRKYTNTHGTI